MTGSGVLQGNSKSLIASCPSSNNSNTESSSLLKWLISWILCKFILNTEESNIWDWTEEPKIEEKWLINLIKKIQNMTFSFWVLVLEVLVSTFKLQILSSSLTLIGIHRWIYRHRIGHIESGKKSKSRYWDFWALILLRNKFMQGPQERKIWTRFLFKEECITWTVVSQNVGKRSRIFWKKRGNCKIIKMMFQMMKWLIKFLLEMRNNSKDLEEWMSKGICCSLNTIELSLREKMMIVNKQTVVSCPMMKSLSGSRTQ